MTSGGFLPFELLWELMVFVYHFIWPLAIYAYEIFGSPSPWAFISFGIGLFFGFKIRGKGKQE